MSSSPVILTPDQRLRVFISANADELSDERKAAEGAVAALHMIPLRCDWVGASSRTTPEGATSCVTQPAMKTRVVRAKSLIDLIVLKC